MKQSKHKCLFYLHSLSLREKTHKLTHLCHVQPTVDTLALLRHKLIPIVNKGLYSINKQPLAVPFSSLKSCHPFTRLSPYLEIYDQIIREEMWEMSAPRVATLPSAVFSVVYHVDCFHPSSCLALL